MHTACRENTHTQNFNPLTWHFYADTSTNHQHAVQCCESSKIPSHNTTRYRQVGFRSFCTVRQSGRHPRTFCTVTASTNVDDRPSADEWRSQELIMRRSTLATELRFQHHHRGCVLCWRFLRFINVPWDASLQISPIPSEGLPEHSAPSESDYANPCCRFFETSRSSHPHKTDHTHPMMSGASNSWRIPMMKFSQLHRKNPTIIVPTPVYGLSGGWRRKVTAFSS